MADIYDVVIIGGGPAGLTAGLYACRARMKTLLLERMACGGQALITDVIENFPGFPEGIKGPDLADWMFRQAERFGLAVMDSEAAGIAGDQPQKEPFAVILKNGPEISSNALIIATGARWNTIGIPGEAALSGRGVSYCATCDGPLFNGKEVVVIGGGDTALEDALYLTRFATRVSIVHRRKMFRATKILQEKVAANKKIELWLDSIATEIIGKNKVEAVKVKDISASRERILSADGVFVFVGVTPNSEIVKGVVDLDEKGYIICDDDMRTSAAGIFACGDVRKKLLRQIVTAAGDGATAAFSAQHYIEYIKGIEYK